MRRTKTAAWETRNRILDAAEHVFVARGVASATLSDIASAASVTRGAIYGHFENKSELFASMIERAGLPTEALVKEVANTPETEPLDHIRKVFAESLHGVARNPRTWRIFAIIFRKYELADESCPVLVRCRRAADELQMHLQAALRQAVHGGQLPGNLDVEFSSSLLLVLWNGVLLEWLSGPIANAPGNDADRIAQSWLDMLRYSPTCLGEARVPCSTDSF
ncbi:MAG TPA: TetR family transcriptional regulator [Paraburkholderia sp.]|jgi:TetR/AcrR family acrAB operon transcriptional repressor|uniref:TetR family transcriptional regulator n=1 Tax=Paraburkholderia sp. TaxID=1926495 RepID=UPI002B47D50C|nr:TetR family transcriptional regulator [Paraburkholderia sp.]HKR40068.1 TetR family transcriptional regulator [Paraburkholderia sp.]